MREQIAPLLLIVVLATALPGSALALWPEQGYPLSISADHQVEAKVAGDGGDGMIIVWRDYRYGNWDLFAQRIDAYGNRLWAENGVPVITVTGDQTEFDIVEDGAGGVIVAWEDWRSGSYSDLYCQHLDADGARLWSIAGVSLCSASGNQEDPRITTDGASGAIVVWKDGRNGNADIYARRIDSNGTAQWTIWGEPVCIQASTQTNPCIASKGDGGAIIAWEDYRNGNADIYCELLFPDGSAWYYAGGMSLCNLGNSQIDPMVISIGYNEAIFAWIDGRISDINKGLYGQRFSSGSFSWGTNGREMCQPSLSSVYEFDAVVDSQNRIIVAWCDQSGGSRDVYAQYVDMAGWQQWGAGGVVVCDANYSQSLPKIAAGEDGTTVISWIDERDGLARSLYAQRLDELGASLWTDDGVEVCGTARYESDHDMMPDGEGGVLIAWSDTRNDPAHIQNDLFAQRMERNGYRGWPAPEIYALRDVPGDEGGKINLAWFASYLDPYPRQQITHYTIWRAIDPVAASLMIDGGGARTIESLAEIPSAQTGRPVIRIESAGASTFFWELVDSQDALFYERYSSMVATGFDSSAATSEYHYFQVAAHTADPLAVWTSEPDSGRSVDNLAPAAPVGLAGEQVFTPEGLLLTWEENAEPDLRGYVIYRGLSADFVPETGTFLAEVTEAGFFDGGWDWEPGYWYKVAALDIHDNVSGYALLGPSELTGDDDPLPPLRDYVAQNFPNPFNPSTTIRFGLREASPVSIRIYDVSGRLVRTLVESRFESGHHSIAWDGLDDAGGTVSSGIYFYRISSKDIDRTCKMVLLR